MSIKTIGGNLLFWKISITFVSLLVILGAAYVSIAAHISKKYYIEVHQKMFRNIASHLAESTRPFKNGAPDTLVMHDIIHSAMLVNPSVEVYLLDTLGTITYFVAPNESVKMDHVNLDAIKQFVATKGKKYMAGDNPKNPGEECIFSAAPGYENGNLKGYVYVVLASRTQEEIINASDNNLFLSLGGTAFFATLFITFIVGIITFFLITDSICQVAQVVKRFKEGDYKARIEGSIKGNLGVLTSAFNDMADVIVDNIKKMTSTDKLRQELIANVSHDLRTPLSIMQGYVETLIIKEHSISQEERDKYLAIIMDSTKKLSILVDQLFQYSMLEANEVSPQKEQFLLNDLVSGILEKYQMLAEEKDIDIQWQSSSKLLPVYADMALLERVIQNLLDNAIKFTPRGGHIFLQLRNNQSRVEVHVADTGIGIDEEDLAYIFERYKKLPGKWFQRSDSAGLGLAIVKKILELHQSSINVKSILGKGTTFWFDLPLINISLDVLAGRLLPTENN
jgi:signal transduction histidine kinase